MTILLPLPFRSARCGSALGILGLLLVGILSGCADDRDRHFVRLEAERTGIDFVNTIPADDSLMNPLDFFYVYNGGGVGVGDLNGDDRPDLYFAGNAVSNRLYLNEGDLLVLDMLPQSPRRRRLVSITGARADGQWQYVRNTLQLNRGAPGGHTVFSEVGQQAGIEATGWSWAPLLADYDNDGDRDLFVGGRVVPGSYPLPPRSYLLRNDSGNGRVQFTDVTAQIAPGLAEVGLVSDALWTDVTGDARVDLLIAGEWMPLTVLANEGDRFTNRTAQMGLAHTSGWWNSLAAGDFDRDGDTDYVAGNLGRNTRYEASAREPVRVHAKDFDQNGRVDPVLSHYIRGTSYPAHGRRELLDQIHSMRKRFPSYRAYAGTPLSEVLPADAFTGALLRGDGTGRFTHVPSAQSGFFVDGDAKALAEVTTGEGPRSCS